MILVFVDSSVRSMDEDDCFSNQDSDYSGDFMTMGWAKVCLPCPFSILTFYKSVFLKTFNACTYTHIYMDKLTFIYTELHEN